MKDIYKNPNLYYILVPAIFALWPLFAWGVSLPRANRSLDKELKDYQEANVIIEEILKHDPDRLELANSKIDSEEFDYARAIQHAANLCGIPPANYKLSSGIVNKQKGQSANISLKQVDLEKFANFLSTIQLRWANLRCNTLKLTKKKGLPDVWDVDLEFKYYY